MNQFLCEKKEIKLQEIKQMEPYEESYGLLENDSKYVGPVINGMPNGFGKEYGKGTITKFVSNRIEVDGEFIDGHFCGI